MHDGCPSSQKFLVVYISFYCSIDQVYFHFDRLKKERQKLAEAHQELKARREKGEGGLTIQGLMVVQIQRSLLWRDAFIIQVPAPNPTANA